MDTLASIRTEILGWLRGDYQTTADTPLVNAAINDATEDIWNAMMPVALARFFGLDSPVTFSLPSGAERVRLVSIVDPTFNITVTQVPGGAINDGASFGVAVSFVTESGSETLLSPIVQTAGRNPNSLFKVTSPNATQFIGTPFGYNVYVGGGPGGIGSTPMALQNQQPIPIGTDYIEPTTAWQGYPIFQQQPPLENTTADNISWINHMEVRTSDTLLRSWNQYDIDSELMRRYGRQLSSASEYQTYVWDLVNGNRLEFRPSAGMTFTPRYFYIAKPRRLRYDQADMPYVQIAGVHEYIVDKSIARLKLGVEEYAASQAWNGEAAVAKAGILSALTQEVWAKNTRIAPHLF